MTYLINKIRTAIIILIGARKNHMKVIRIGEIVGHLQPLGYFKKIQDIVAENPISQ